VRHYLWRAVDQHGNVLDILLQSRRDAKAAKRFMAKLMKKQRRAPRVLVTDKLRSYNVAHRELMPSVEHRSHKGLNNRAESRVGDWRGGLRGSVSSPRPSNRACASRAPGLPTSFTSWHALPPCVRSRKGGTLRAG
jgi:transposase-like protein